MGKGLYTHKLLYNLYSVNFLSLIVSHFHYFFYSGSKSLQRWLYARYQYRGAQPSLGCATAREIQRVPHHTCPSIWTRLGELAAFRRNAAALFFLIACSSCATTVTVNSVRVKSPQRKVNKQEFFYYLGAAITGYAGYQHFKTPRK